SVGTAIKKICSTFVLGWAGKCHRVVDRYVQPIEDGLAQDLEPRDICVSIGMCESPGHPAGGRFLACSGPRLQIAWWMPRDRDALCQ
ncbi:unnamed protein product, partial [Lepidochelys kempii]